MRTTTVNLTDLKDFSEIKKGVKIKAIKATLLGNPTGYVKLLNDIENYAKKSGLTISHEDKSDHYIIKIT